MTYSVPNRRASVLRACAGRRSTGDAAKWAGGGFGKRVGWTGRHSDGAVLLISYRRHETPAVVADAPKQIGGEIRAVAFFGNALPNAESKTFIIGPGDEIDDACHCVGAIDRRCAVLEDIGARKRGDWDHVEVRRAVGARAARDEAAAVDRKSPRPNSSH